MPFDAEWLRTHKKGAAAAGAAGLVGALALYQRHKAAAAGTAAASGTAVVGTPTINGVPTVSGTAGFDSSQLDQYNQLAGAISNANDSIDTIQAQVNKLAAGTTVQKTNTGLPNPAAKGPADYIPGYTHVVTDAEAKAYTAAGIPMFALPAGAPFSASLLIPYTPKTAPSLPKGSYLFIKG